VMFSNPFFSRHGSIYSRLLSHDALLAYPIQCAPGARRPQSQDSVEGSSNEEAVFGKLAERRRDPGWIVVAERSSDLNDCRTCVEATCTRRSKNRPRSAALAA
jgi:hypothetical protein